MANSSSLGKALIVPAILLVACFTNPSMNDFEQYLRQEAGVLSLHEYKRSNLYIFSLYKSSGVSLRRGEEHRTVVGLFGNFIPLSERSSW